MWCMIQLSMRLADILCLRRVSNDGWNWDPREQELWKASSNPICKAWWQILLHAAHSGRQLVCSVPYSERRVHAYDMMSSIKPENTVVPLRDPDAPLKNTVHIVKRQSGCEIYNPMFYRFQDFIGNLYLGKASGEKLSYKRKYK